MFGGVYVECSLEDAVAGRLATHLGYCLCIYGLSVVVCGVMEKEGGVSGHRSSWGGAFVGGTRIAELFMEGVSSQ